MVDAPEPWEQLPNETGPAFAAFRIYRELGYRRTIGEVAREIQKSRRQVEAWSSKFDWGTRARAYDFDRDRIWLDETRENHKVAARRHADAAQVLSDKTMDALNHLTKKKLYDTAPRDLAYMAQAAARIEMDVTGGDVIRRIEGTGGTGATSKATADTGTVKIHQAYAELTPEARQARLVQLMAELSRRTRTLPPGAEEPAGDDLADDSAAADDGDTQAGGV